MNDITNESSIRSRYFHRPVSFLRPYLGLICLVLLICTLISLLILTGYWFCLFHNVQVSMPRTFAWELIIQLLGSYYDDCIDHSPGEFPIETVPTQQCGYTASLPWIPLMGALVCLFTVCTVASVWLIRLIRRRLIVSIMLTDLVKVVLIYLCLAESFHLAVGLRSKHNNVAAAEGLRQHMGFTMNRNPDQLPDEIYFRWDVTQARSECCGIDGPSDWTFSIFKDGNPRYPMSCCDKNKSYSVMYGVVSSPNQESRHFICKQTRRELWQEGCVTKIHEIVESYQNWFLQLLILSWISVVLTTISSWLLETCLLQAPLIPPEKDLSPIKLLREKISIRFKRLPGQSDKDKDARIQQEISLAKRIITALKSKKSQCTPVPLAEEEKSVNDEVMIDKLSNNSFRKAIASIGTEQNQEDVVLIKTCCSLKDIDLKPIFTKKYKTSTIQQLEPDQCPTYRVIREGAVIHKETMI